ncbi:hypothetical protein [Aneurinibacillus tyrosinisolvens]|uniref:hypothetical protein n=1 Tax=Aneurinibacillus tyrosinisolvens TaxID=1443435 RepID=UPI001F2F8703|nr:hypothetical protein [Aneurinibacillus tyrosinisolvens]
MKRGWNAIVTTTRFQGQKRQSHRYGQKHDVVVINFLNRKNEADKRVFHLLSEKFSLFNGIFGSSDEVLGSLESGVDFEKRIQQIYQNCRTAEEISAAFNQLQQELDEQIQNKMQETRESLLENFDDEVREKLRNHYEQTNLYLNRLERYLWGLSKYEGNGQAVFNDEQLSFQLKNENEVYQMISQVKKVDPGNQVHHYRSGHPLAVEWIEQAKSRALPPKGIIFRYSDYEGKVSVLSPLVGQEGWLSLNLLRVESLEMEEYLVFSCVDREGNQIEQDICEKMFDLPASEGEETSVPASIQNALAGIKEHQEAAILNGIMERAGQYLDAELEKLDKWSGDLKMKLESEIENIGIEINQQQREARLTKQLAEKLELNRKVKELEKKRNDMRRNLYNEQDEIDRQKEVLFAQVEEKLQQKVTQQHLYQIHWRIIWAAEV